MAETIKIQPELEDQILVTQRFVHETKMGDLWLKMESGRWKPDPAVILSRMPEEYEGKFRYHLYNGTHRYSLAIAFGLELNGLVVDSVDQIPPAEGLTRNTGSIRIWTPNQRLQEGLYAFLSENGQKISRRTNLPILLRELQRQEAQGILPTGSPYVI